MGKKIKPSEEKIKFCGENKVFDGECCGLVYGFSAVLKRYHASLISLSYEFDSRLRNQFKL